MIYRVEYPAIQCIALWTVALLLLTGVAPAQAISTSEHAEVRINIGKLQHEIKSHIDKIRQSGEEEDSVLDHLARINQGLQKKNEKIATLQKRLQAQQELVTMKEKELKEAEKLQENIKEHMQARLRSFYLMGKVGALNVTFSKDDLPELMLFTDSFQRLISYDQTVIDMYRITVAQLRHTRKARKLEQSLLEEFFSQEKDEQLELETLRSEQEGLLNRIKTQQSLYQLAIKELHKAEDEMAASLEQLKEKDAFRQRGFMLARGTLPPPVDGEVRLRFGDILQQGLGKGDSIQGITIDTEAGATVHAVYAGRVVVAGYKRGYGNMVILEHGMGYFTITSRLAAIMVNEGESVVQNQQIGTTGDIATLFEDGLYFEIRHHSIPEDPLLWLGSGE